MSKPCAGWVWIKPLRERDEWSEESLDDLAALDKGTAQRIKKAVERFSETGSGNVKKLQGIDPPEFRLRVGDFRVRFHSNDDILYVLRVRNKKKLTGTSEL